MEFVDGLAKAGDALQKAGPWGLLALSLVVCTVLWNKLEKERSARVTDWREIGDLVKANTLASANWTTEAAARTRALEASVRSQEMSAATQATASSTLASLVEAIRALTSDSRRTLETVLMQKGAQT